jgi:hypothetical protein
LDGFFSVFGNLGARWDGRLHDSCDIGDLRVV